ncbi:sulfite exporter TauE/SafE family protein [Novosphingobium flavum]|uniref:Probable membrane transporter protein n=1 Tax=Novosphingobium flavum TaxID=1778672 RepID=A0A7X1FUB3_9SPHN|nr:sulfite exporter TauE/SafE family protein [Novosphingobium flavum]MBC2667111.1 sulfite exporter TauE/SafE family protein [Novosphingobium flavum]
MSLLADPLTLVLACLAVIIVGAAKGGLSGVGALGTPILALALPPAEAAAVLLPVLLVQDAVSVWAFRKEWDRWIVGWMLPGCAIGIALATGYAALVDERRLLLLLGLITFGFGAFRLWVERGGRAAAPSTSPGWVGLLFGVATGVTSQVAHAGGPPFQMWVTPRRLPHERYIGTSAVLFAAMNWLKVPGYVMLGTLNRQTLAAAALLLPLAVVSTLFTLRLIRRMRSGRFYIVIYVLMVLLGAKLVWDGIA